MPPRPQRTNSNRALVRDILALAIAAAAVFIAVSLVSFDPADPPSRLVFPTNEAVQNVCGRAGALVALFLLDTVGVAAYYVVLSLAILAGVLLTHGAIDRAPLRLSGWLLSLAAIAGQIGLLVSAVSPGSVHGPGGRLGATIITLLQPHVAPVGAGIILSTLTLVGWFLTTEYAILSLVGGGARAVGRLASRLRKKPQAAATSTSGQRRKKAEPSSSKTATPRWARLWQWLRGGHAADGQENTARRRAMESDLVKRGGALIKKMSLAQLSDGDAPSEEAGREPFPVHAASDTSREALLAEIEKTSSEAAHVDYELPSIHLLLPGNSECSQEQSESVRRQGELLEKTFENFGYHVEVTGAQTGPVISQFEIQLEAGLRLSKITGLSEDLAIALKVPSVRIVAPIPGKNTVGIEVPTEERQLVRLREVIEQTFSAARNMRIPVFLGKDVAGNPLVVDLTSLPHLLIAGRTGTGKSVCLNSIIVSMLMQRRPDEVRLLLIDPKMVELSPYKSIPHLMHPVVTDMRKAEAILAWAVDKMEKRYELLARAGVRHLSVYNQLGEDELRQRLAPASEAEWEEIPKHMPYIVIVADEMADLMMTAAKEVENHIIRLAQKSRAVGIHLVLATQKPTVDIVTGLIKSNLPARICFEVASRVDSRVVLDEMGADKLLGNGDMLFLRPGTNQLLRGQGTYVTDDEINSVIRSIAVSEPNFVEELVQLEVTDDEAAPTAQGRSARDLQIYPAAVDVVLREGRGSVSLLQRTLGIGYGKAARMIDFMAEDGIVGPYNGAQAREVLMTLEQWHAKQEQDVEEDAEAGPLFATAADRKLAEIQRQRQSNQVAHDIKAESVRAKESQASEIRLRESGAQPPREASGEKDADDAKRDTA